MTRAPTGPASWTISWAPAELGRRVNTGRTQLEQPRPAVQVGTRQVAGAPPGPSRHPHPRWRTKVARRSRSIAGSSRTDEPLQKRGRETAGEKIGVPENPEVQRDGRLDAFDDCHLERASHPVDRLRAVPPVGDNLRQQRVVVRRHRAVCVRECIDPDPGPPGTLKVRIRPGLGTNVSGCSAFTRHSIACPVNRTSACLNDSPSPLAIRSAP